MVVFDRELTYGVWRFLAKATKSNTAFGIGIIDANQSEIQHPFRINNRLNNSSICFVGKMLYVKGIGKIGAVVKEIQNGDQIGIVIDLQRIPHTFSLTINATTQPFCVTHIPDNVKFVFILISMNDEWKFIQLNELKAGVDLSKIDEKSRYKFE
ncbi:MAG: hypothetical protein EZS28_051115 [Streblomastix strix]|uniref:SPRY domain-containing protein n=1 Tax=Streblomastix strix TaxID=222440 RepID=A0A5J4T5D9_9EUKA|nr:MAG: hypothetical protein EZS28_051115 [Streblomastix strix]